MPSVTLSGTGQMEPGSIVPGSFKSTINLGTRYVPAPTAGQATWNEFLRGYAPWGPLLVDPSPTGFAGGFPGRVGRALPYVGGTIGAFEAGEAASQKQGQMVPVPPRQWGMDLFDTLRNILRIIPGQAATVAGMGVGVGKGLTGLFQDHPDRTGVATGMQTDSFGPRRDVPGGPSFAPGGSYYDLPQNTNFQRSLELPWGGEPGGEGFQGMIPPSFVPTVPSEWPQPTQGPSSGDWGLRTPWPMTTREPWS